MVINTNVSAQTGARLLSESSNALAKSLSRLSSGSKIISPEDDAAGLAVSMKLDAQLLCIDAARNNVGNAVSFNQTQDGFLGKVAKALDRMSELSILAQDATKTSSDQDLYDAEYTQLGAYIDDLSTKEFNGVSLFDGAALSVTTDSEGATFDTTGVDLTAGAYTGATAAHINTGTPQATYGLVKAALDQLAIDRANVGANISVLNSYNDQLGALSDNLSQANSRIKDVDVAEESTTFAKYNILVQAGTAMLAQANQVPQGVLKLLG